MPSLRSKIDELAAELTAGILAAVRKSSLSELIGATNVAAATSKKRGMSPPTKPTTTGDVSATIFVLLKNHPEGLRSEQIQKLAAIKKPAAVKALTGLLASKLIRKTGKRRATTYLAK